MFKEILFVAGGAYMGARIGVALGKYLYGKYKEHKTTVGKVQIENLCDDECIVDELIPSILTEWFKTKNPDNHFENVVILPTDENLKEYKISEFVKYIPENSLFQIIYDEKTDTVQRVRLVNYGIIQEKLKDTLEKANGILIVGE